MAYHHARSRGCLHFERRLSICASRECFEVLSIRRIAGSSSARRVAQRIAPLQKHRGTDKGFLERHVSWLTNNRRPSWEDLEWVIRSSIHSITAYFQKLRREARVNFVGLQFLEYEALFNHFLAVVDNFWLIEFAGITSNFFNSCIKS